MKTLVWLRQDIRTEDNPALFHACRQGLAAAVFLITAELWRKHHRSARQIKLLLTHLQALQQNLNKKNIGLKTILCQERDIPYVLANYAKTLGASAFYFNKHYEWDELQHQQSVSQTLASEGIKVSAFEGQCLLAPGTLLNQSHAPYQVFTPFKQALLSILADQPLSLLPPPTRQECFYGENSPISLKIAAYPLDHCDIGAWAQNESQAVETLHNFLSHHLCHYHLFRDIPAKENTSKLSPYLAIGSLSVRTCLKAAQHYQQQAAFMQGARLWINELLWREFYRHILFHFPELGKNKPFKAETKKVNWQNNPHHFHAWQQGQTGYPLIDAAMRQLGQTGWMHNRLRMVTAMFLCKNLLIDWRLGQQYFMQQLIDGDFASNNGNWQWCASTGVDAVPYFRLFNPVRQSQRFDKEGIFIRRYCPELSTLDSRSIHDPTHFARHLLPDLPYPKAIVDLKATRLRALAAYQGL